MKNYSIVRIGNEYVVQAERNEHSEGLQPAAGRQVVTDAAELLDRRRRRRRRRATEAINRP